APVNAQVGAECGGAADGVGTQAAGGQNGQVRHRAGLPGEDLRHRPDIRAGHGAQAVEDGHPASPASPVFPASPASLAVDAMVPEPSTMSPPSSGRYSTAAWPGATPRSGSSTVQVNAPPVPAS